MSNKLPKDWKIKTLGDILKITSGSGLTKSKRNDEGEYLVYGGNGITGKHNEYLFEEERLIIGRVGVHCGNAYITKPKSWVTDNAFVVSFNEVEINKKFLLNLIGVLNLNKYSVSTAQPVISQGTIYPIEITLPPFETQTLIVSKIEELFSELDKGIEDLKTAQQQLKTYRQSVLKWAFEGKLTEEWRKINKSKKLELFINEIRLKRKQSGIKVKYGKVKSDADKKLLPIPKEWEWIRNEELIFYVTSGSRDWKKYYSEKGSFFIRTQNLNTNSLDLSDAAFVELPEKVEGKRSLVEYGDLLMTITGANVGKVAYIDHNIPEAYVSQSVALMKYIDKRIIKYLWYYFQCNDFGKGLISGLVYGVGRPVLNLENMKEVPIAFCTLEEQYLIVQEIESRLSVADKMEESIVQSLLQSESLRLSILKKAFSGELI